MLVNKRHFYALRRRPDLTVKPDVRLLLLNQGGHLFIADKITLIGQPDWKWVRFADFDDGNFIYLILGDTPLHRNVRLKHQGHRHRLALVTLTQYYESRGQVLKDWMMSFYLLPNCPVLVHTEGGSVFASRICL